MPPPEAPLAPYTVLDFTIARAGPTAVRLLADWGANVIRIEAPAARQRARDDGPPPRQRRAEPASQQAQPVPGPEVAARPRGARSPGAAQRRGGRELPRRRQRAAGPRLRTLACAQSTRRAGQHLGLRAGRAVCRPARRRSDRAGPERPDVDHRRARPRADARGHRGIRHRGRHVPRPGHPAGAAATRAHRRRPMGAHVAARGDAQQARLPGRALHDERRSAGPGGQPPPHPRADGHLPRERRPGQHRGQHAEDVGRAVQGARRARTWPSAPTSPVPSCATATAVRSTTRSTLSRSASAPPSWCSGSIRWACRAGRSTTSARHSKTRRCSTCA